MNREETLKKFNTYSSLFLVLGILDLVLIWLSFGNKDMIALLHGGGSAAASALRVLFLVTVVLGAYIYSIHILLNQLHIFLYHLEAFHSNLH